MQNDFMYIFHILPCCCSAKYKIHTPTDTPAKWPWRSPLHTQLLRVFSVHPRFHTPNVVLNLGRTWKTPSPTITDERCKIHEQSWWICTKKWAVKSMTMCATRGAPPFQVRAHHRSATVLASEPQVPLLCLCRWCLPGETWFRHPRSFHPKDLPLLACLTYKDEDVTTLYSSQPVLLGGS